MGGENDAIVTEVSIASFKPTTRAVEPRRHEEIVVLVVKKMDEAAVYALQQLFQDGLEQTVVAQC